ncbi:nickel pincer cofactor biosynthesis protein LarC [Gloeobacter morelensis]|uniref:Putative nickel insertion protein n=1 Tax=Gloeobacter morelensis MG652769 TaxID=2781736 RepID=A0ABY3PID9_9CYAN|nr:nickel pincer cofactor biosynthesis protein LarC [Gloeobacter morelensis]UFP93383.1 nickel pincer cofactor biosynthesis protein LarC [Gloeobacter morelensis MG652769]
MKLAYFDCPAGISGDMCLGALVDAGVPADYLSAQLAKLPMHDEYRLHFERVVKNGVAATKARVPLGERAGHTHRHLPEIRALLETASLPPRATEWSVRVFVALAHAEALVHNTTPERVHFHEVGATDALVDVVGTCLGLDYLNVEALHCSALPVGGGLVHAAHGVMPVPTPAVVRLWESRRVPVYSNRIHRELVTPTGAAIACALAASFGEMPAMAVSRVGLGAGDMDLPIPNILRLWLGEATEPLLAARAHTVTDAHTQGRAHAHHDHAHEEVVACLETQTDDLNPQISGYLFERLLAAGAADVFTVPVGMKKSRPGTLMTVLCAPHLLATCEEILLCETTTLGVRRHFQVRSVLERHHEPVETIFGTVRIKVGSRDQQVLNAQPEFEDCRRLSEQTGQPLKLVQQVALATWHQRRPTQSERQN